MARNFCDKRIIVLAAAAVYLLTQVRFFTDHSEYADRLPDVESESRCLNQMHSLIDQISTHEGKLAAMEEAKKLRDEDCFKLESIIQDINGRSVQKWTRETQKSVNTSQARGLRGRNLLVFLDECMVCCHPTLPRACSRSGIYWVPIAAVVIMACNRPDYLERTIQSVSKYQGSIAEKFPLFISQDGTNPDVKSKALSYPQITYMQHLDLEPVIPERPGEIVAYYKIARHYKWALDELFSKRNFRRVIILEDDMEIAPDFFDYFEAAAILLEQDKSIMAVSSWNDNGQVQFVHDPHALYRSDFFPGLGWMLTRSVWNELSPKWPKAYWDDWVRLKEVHKDRQFVHPEICRTYNFGEHGSSKGQFFKQYLEPIRLNGVQVDWKSMDLSYVTEDKFQSYFSKAVADARPIQGADLSLKAHNVEGDVRIQYNDQRHFEQIAGQFGIFEEWKDGIPRTAYKGVVVFRLRGPKRIFLVGPNSLRLLGIEKV